MCRFHVLLVQGHFSSDNWILWAELFRFQSSSVAYREENMAADSACKGFKMADNCTCTVYFTRMDTPDLQSSTRLFSSQYPQCVILSCFLYVGCPDHARAWGIHRAPLASCAGRRTGCTLLWWPSPPTSARTPPPSSESSQSRNCTVVTRAGAAFLNTFREDQYRVKGGQTSSCVRTTANSSSQVLMGVSVLI